MCVMAQLSLVIWCDWPYAWPEGGELLNIFLLGIIERHSSVHRNYEC